MKPYFNFKYLLGVPKTMSKTKPNTEGMIVVIVKGVLELYWSLYGIYN